MYVFQEQRGGLLNMSQTIPGKLMIKLKGKSRDNIYWNVPHSQACLRCYDCYRQRLIPCILPLIKQRWNGINEWNESTAELKDKRHLCWNSSRANFTPTTTANIVQTNLIPNYGRDDITVYGTYINIIKLELEEFF
jgi:hypothetical protein